MAFDMQDLDEAAATVSILRAVSTLTSGREMEVLVASDLPFLYPELKRRGLAWTSVSAGDGILITIRAGG
jgi:hypothetical protein